jgi:putative hydrolase of the HAD superfamily
MMTHGRGPFHDPPCRELECRGGPGPSAGVEYGEKRMPDLILVDFDDTLVETAPAFHQAREALFRRLEEEGFSPDVSFRVHHEEVEPELLALFGMGPFRLEPSFRDTYVRLCVAEGRTPDPAVADECGSLGRDFMGHPKVMEGAAKALQRLAIRFPTGIFSQASHPEYQMGRIRDAGITQVLAEDRIRITHRKTRETFLDALRHFGTPDPGRAVMIGNSFRSDINPALEAGAGAILVEPYEMWHYDNVPPVSQEFLRFPTFGKAVGYLLRDGRE